MANISKIHIESGTYDVKDLTALHCYNTLADLKIASGLKANEYVKTEGYYNINDGGSAIYRIRLKEITDTTNDNDIIELSDETLIAEIIVADILNVKQFGCYGDNTHDDSSNFQNAVNYCQLHHYNLIVPTGNYKLLSSINVTGCNIQGYGRNTWLWLSSHDGLILNHYNEQTICEIKGLSFYSNDGTNWKEIAGICFKEYNTSDRSRGYKISECYFENLGCAIEVNDTFRTTIQNININNCFRSLWIKRQTVQCYFNNIISNYDNVSAVNSTRYGTTSIGIQIGLSGATNRCEGIKIDTCCMTNHDVGLYQYDALFSNIVNCEFDLCRKEGMIIYSWEGNCNIKNNWIVTQSSTSEPIVDIQTSSTSVKYKLNLDSNLIGNVNGHLDKIGVAVGRISDYYFRDNVSILNNTIKNFNNSTPLKYGIYVDRGRECSIIGNYSNNCSTADILFAPDGTGMMNNNIVSTIDLTVYSGTTVYAYSNIATTVTKSVAGTLIGDLD